jgi:hypothetical protein
MALKYMSRKDTQMSDEELIKTNQKELIQSYFQLGIHLKNNLINLAEKPILVVSRHFKAVQLKRVFSLKGSRALAWRASNKYNCLLMTLSAKNHQLDVRCFKIRRIPHLV